MLLIPIGTAGRQLTFEPTETHRCATCGEARTFELQLVYEWGSLFYVPVCVTERQYRLVCAVCRHGWVLERRAAEARLGGDPIPWLQRNGWMIFVGIALVAGTAFARSRGLV